MRFQSDDLFHANYAASKSFFWFAIVVLLILSSYRMAGTRAKDSKHDDHESMMLSANDRSRWAMIYAMAEFESFSIDKVIESDRRWNTIDKVVHRGQDGKLHQYSSKPPLFPMLLTADYWVISKLTGLSFPDNTVAIQWIILVTTNLIPFIVFVWLIFLITTQMVDDQWTVRYLIAATAFGTFLTGFVTTLNNHLPAAISVAAAIYAVLQILGRQRVNAYWFAVAGGFGAFSVVNELPSLSFLAAITGWLALYHFRYTMKYALPTAAIVAVAFLGTNYWAHDSLRPPYAHRSDGKVIGTVDEFFVNNQLRLGVASEKFRTEMRSVVGLALSEEATLISHKRNSGRVVLLDEGMNSQYSLKARGKDLVIRRWDNWYDYPGSYWLDGNRKGVDIGESSRGLYFLHMTIGHHGILSLTPIWIISLIGCVLMLKDDDVTVKQLAMMTVLLSVVCLGFYVMRPMLDRNYGGVASGFRWMFWFSSIYLICMIPAVKQLSMTRFGRVVLIVLLGMSAFSALWGFYNPWVHPWTYTP